MISLGVQMYNTVLSWYLTSLPKTCYKNLFFVKNDTVLYHMIKYVFLQEYAKISRRKNKVEARFCHIFSWGKNVLRNTAV